MTYILLTILFIDLDQEWNWDRSDIDILSTKLSHQNSRMYFVSKNTFISNIKSVVQKGCKEIITNHNNWYLQVESN